VRRLAPLFRLAYYGSIDRLKRDAQTGGAMTAKGGVRCPRALLPSVCVCALKLQSAGWAFKPQANDRPFTVFLPPRKNVRARR